MDYIILFTHLTLQSGKFVNYFSIRKILSDSFRDRPHSFNYCRNCWLGAWAAWRLGGLWLGRLGAWAACGSFTSNSCGMATFDAILAYSERYLAPLGAVGMAKSSNSCDMTTFDTILAYTTMKNTSKSKLYF